MIEFRDVAVCYAPESRHPIYALNGINLHIDAGEWIFLVGASGAGKSSLLKLIYCGAHATKGQIILDGRDITSLPARDIPLLRRKIGVVFQDFQLLTQKTVWENVAFALQVIGAPQRRLVRDVPRALATVGLAHKADSLPHELSGGEQQRVAIARAIVNDPAILLADEPTGNLDPQTGADIVEVLQRIHEEGTTVIMSTHDRSVVDRLQRRVVRLGEGRLISDEEHGVYHPEDGVLYVEPGSGPAPSVENRPRSTFAPPAVVPVSSGVPIASAPGNSPAAGRTVSPPVAPSVQITTPQGTHSAGSGPVGNGPVGSGPVDTNPGEEGYANRTRRNDAPLGSPENPLMQFDGGTDSSSQPSHSRDS